MNAQLMLPSLYNSAFYTPVVKGVKNTLKYLQCSSNNLILVAIFDNDTQLDLCKHPPQFHDQIG